MSNKPGGPPQSALHLLHRAGQCADELFAGAVGASDLTPRQYAVLEWTSHVEDLSQTSLVDLTGIDRSTLADIVRRLVGKGLLSRRRTRRDARMYAVRITPAGHEALKVAGPASQETENRILSALPVEQRAEFVGMLAKIVSTLGPIASARVSSRRLEAANNNGHAAREPIKVGNGG